MKISSIQQQQKEQSSSSSSSSLPSSTLTKTRVCLRNIPPNWDETKLQQFLQSKSTTQLLIITDCTILRNEKNRKSRQVAFVGLATPEQASHVVQFFHRTYCDGSSQKLIVEYARLKQPPTMESSQLSSKNDTINHTKEQQNDDDSPTKQEFMKQYSSTTTTSRPKFWANDDDVNNNINNYNNPHEDPFVSIPDTPQTITPSETKNSEIVISDLDFLRSKACIVKDDLDSDDDDDYKEKISIPKQHPTVPNDKEKVVRNESINDNNDNNAIQKETSDLSDPNRLFVRNLPFGTTLDDLHQLFQPFGSLQDCHIPVDDQKRSKGFAFVTFDSHHDAKRALHALDGTDWKGRFLHIHIARRHPTTPSLDRNNTSHPTWKVQQETMKNQQQTRTHQGWSASLVRGDAVVDTMAARLGISPADILNLKDGHSGDAAVRVALGETQILEENRQFFAQHGVDMEALVSTTTNGDDWKRSQTMILVKNLPFPTEHEELVNLFGKVPSRILLPPSRTIALVEFGHPVDAKRAFKKLAYKRFKHVPLYLEWAPLICQNVTADATNDSSTLNSTSQTNPENEEDEIDNSNMTTGFSIYIQNLHFDTTEQDLQRIFTDAQIPIRAVRIPRKVAPRKAGTSGGTAVVSLSLGYGFVECDSEESVRTAIAKLQGVVVHDHAWQLQRSTNKVTETRPHPFGGTSKTTTTTRRRQLPTKLVCRNVPFQATRKELIQLFGSTHVLKKVRLPTKFDGNHRGFAFIEFSSHADAEAAKKSLSRTHLYGRHLVLEWAEEDENVSQDDDDKINTDHNLTALRSKAKRDMAKLDLDVAPNKRKKLLR